MLEKFENNFELNENLLGDKFKENAQRSIEEKTQAVYNYLLELSEKASNNGAKEIMVRPSDDTAIVFNSRDIRNSVIKKFKNENIKMRVYFKGLYHTQSYIHISW